MKEIKTLNSKCHICDGKGITFHLYLKRTKEGLKDGRKQELSAKYLDAESHNITCWACGGSGTLYFIEGINIIEVIHKRKEVIINSNL